MSCLAIERISGCTQHRRSFREYPHPPPLPTFSTSLYPYSTLTVYIPTLPPLTCFCVHLHIPLAHSARAGVRTAFDTLHQTMKVKEEKIEQLLVQIESRVIDRFKDTVVAGTANRNNWVLPFIFMVIFLGGLTAMACMKYRHMAKSHLF